MKVRLLFIGKTDAPYLTEGIEAYLGRLRRYIDTEAVAAPVPKKWGALPPDLRKEKEAEIILRHMGQCDYCVLLDEKGSRVDSRGFARFLHKRMHGSTKLLLFVVGGPWGFGQEAYRKADSVLSFSPMTFSHQMIRLFLTEQLYRAMTIIRGQPYHNE